MWGERTRRRLVAHEPPHLWWGGEPALLDVDHMPWLNEALTESTALHAIAKAYGLAEAELMRQWLGQTFQWWRLKGTADAPINLRPDQSQDLTQLSVPAADRRGAAAAPAGRPRGAEALPALGDGGHFDQDWGVMEVKDPQVRRILGLP